MHGEFLLLYAAVHPIDGGLDEPGTDLVAHQAVQLVILHVGRPVVLGVDLAVVESERSILDGLHGVAEGLARGQGRLGIVVHPHIIKYVGVHAIDQTGLVQAVVELSLRGLAGLDHSVGVVAGHTATHDIAHRPVEAARLAAVAEHDLHHVVSLLDDGGGIGTQAVLHLVGDVTEIGRAILAAYQHVCVGIADGSNAAFGIDGHCNQSVGQYGPALLGIEGQFHGISSESAVEGDQCQQCDKHSFHHSSKSFDSFLLQK